METNRTARKGPLLSRPASYARALETLETRADGARWEESQRLFPGSFQGARPYTPRELAAARAHYATLALAEQAKAGPLRARSVTVHAMPGDSSLDLPPYWVLSWGPGTVAERHRERMAELARIERAAARERYSRARETADSEASARAERISTLAAH